VITFSEAIAPRATVIVVGLRDAPMLGACLESIVANVVDIAYEVIVVLNDPSPARAAEVEQTVRGAHVITFRANLGFGGAVSVAAERARGEYIVLLNDDCTVMPGWLESLVETEERRAACAVVGSTLVSAEGRLQEAGAVIWADGVTCHVGEGLDVGFMGFERRVDYCSGGSLLIRRDVWNELGGFDSAFFPAYYEDVDFCLRAARAGWEVWYQPKSVVRHARSNSTDPTFRQFLWERARQTFLARWSTALADREPTGALERAVWRAMGTPTRVLLFTQNPSESSGVLETLASDCGMHVCVFATDRQPAGTSVPGTARVITDLEAHLVTEGVDFDVILATHPLPDTLVVRLRRSFPEADLVTDADVETWPSAVRPSRRTSPHPAPRVRDVCPSSDAVWDMEPERKRELEFAAQRRELDLLSAYGSYLRTHLAREDQERQEARGLADLTRERDELQRELDAERRRVSYRVVQRVLRGLERTRALMRHVNSFWSS
jgi:GT2 family glycosyltransferase